ncbi:hypothetical protein [Thalassoroseus pseudoceratinae]|uniref:hypothetical protein n=1 Tax=Thalassoroseus pseudoceratinae TaxID=2713176 RepID=UPI0014217806|nr:hypothetical protein [Thalassoroseus pseudoceratinae]
MSGIDFSQLLEDVQKDIEDAELEIVELKGIQSYVERKKADLSESKLRPELLDELLEAVNEDLQATEEKLPELEGVRKYAQMKAGGPILKNIKKEAPKSPTFEPTPEPKEPAKPKPPEPVVAEQSKSDSAGPFQRSSDEKPSEAASSAPKEKNMRTVVFGPDGFPVDDEMQ